MLGLRTNPHGGVMSGIEPAGWAEPDDLDMDDTCADAECDTCPECDHHNDEWDES